MQGAMVVFAAVVGPFCRCLWLCRYLCETRLYSIMMVSAGSCFVLMPTASAQNLVSDPGFESVQSPLGGGYYCQAASWTSVGSCNNDYVYFFKRPHSGSYDLDLSGDTPSPNISQTIGGLRAGPYTFSFWWEAFIPGTGVTASVGGQTFSLSTASTTSYTQFSQQVTLGAGSTTIVFAGGTGNEDVDIDDVSLTFLLLAPPLPPGAPTNVTSVDSTIGNFSSNGGTLPAGFFNLFNLTPQQVETALTQLDGEDATDAQKGAFQLMSDFLNLMLDPYGGGGGGGGAGSGATGFAPEQDTTLPPEIALAYNSILTKAPPKQAFNQRWTAWGGAFGGTANTNGNPTVGSTNVNANDYGFAGGMDYHLSPDSLVGFSLAGGGTNWSLAQNLGSGRSDSFMAGVYAKTHSGPWYASAALGYADHWFTTDRASALGDQLRAKFQGQSVGGRLEAGYRYGLPSANYPAGVTPYAALQAQSFHTPTYSEADLTGGGFGLTYNAQTATDTRSELGARFDDLAMLGVTPLILRARLAWAHDWISDPALTAAFQALPGSSFIVNGAAPPHDSALTSLGAELRLTQYSSLTGKFDGEFGNGAQTYGGTGTLRYSW